MEENWHLREPVERNPVTFFDITIGGTPVGRVKMELWSDITPKTAENFRQFCTGEYRKNNVSQGYKDAQFHRVERDFVIQGGDFIRAIPVIIIITKAVYRGGHSGLYPHVTCVKFMQGDGTGVMSIYDGHFPDENFTARHTGPGLLSMANSGRDQNGCQFFITCCATPHLDGKHVVFGRVVEDGLRVIRKIEHVSTDRSKRPTLPVVIAQCGEM